MQRGKERNTLKEEGTGKRIHCIYNIPHMLHYPYNSKKERKYHRSQSSSSSPSASVLWAKHVQNAARIIVTPANMRKSATTPQLLFIVEWGGEGGERREGH